MARGAFVEPLERRAMLCVEPLVAGAGDLRPTSSSSLRESVGDVVVAAASVSGAGAGDVVAAAGATPLYPDLSPWVSAQRGFVHNWQIDKTTEPGRTLLRLSFASSNLGAGPVELRGGAINSDGTQQVFQRIYHSDGTWSDRLAGSFVYHAAHEHIHFADFAEFRLRGVTSGGGVGAIVAGGEKTSFCLLDSVKRDGTLPGAPAAAQYVLCNAVRQGISVGWADLYARDLPDQDIDVTGLANGTYWLEVENDPLDRFVESDETNNVARIKIDLHLSDDSTAAAYNLGALGPAQTYHEFVGAADANDYYQFTLAAAADVNLSLRDLYANANVRLLSGGGTLVAQSTNSGTTAEAINVSNLAAGTYYVHVLRSSGDTTYTLEVRDNAAAATPGTINGTAGADHFRLKRNASNADLVDVFIPTMASPRFSMNVVHLLGGALNVTTQGGDDTLIVDFANGSPAPGGGVTFDGGAGATGAGDLLVLAGTSGNDTATFTTTSFKLGATPVNYADAERFRLDGGGGGGDTLNVNSGTFAFAADAAGTAPGLTVNVAGAAAVTFGATQHLKSLVVAGRASLGAGGAKVLVADTLSVTGAGQLDLNDNDMILHAMPLGAWNGSGYGGVTGLLARGRHGGAWDGAGGVVTSSAAARGGLTTLGVARAGDALGIGATQAATWNGQAVDGDSILVKYTYAGDADLDGTIDADDYGTIDFNVLAAGSYGYRNGDFDFNGVIDVDDYGYIDFNVLAQDGPL